MNNFSERLIELMDKNEVDAISIEEFLNLANTSTVYKWRNGRKSISLKNAIKLADIFNCSLDYLFGRNENYEKGEYNSCPKFGEQLKAVLKEQNSSQNKIIKCAQISAHSLNNWINDKGEPHIKSIIKIADYLKVSMDYLVGREKQT